MHFIKSRNGGTGIGFFRTAYERMSITEIPAPPKQVRKVRI